MKKVLIIDDEKKVRTLIETTLSIGEIEILQASSGEEGLKKAREVMPDIILLDVMMPGIDGFEVCRLLKKDPATKDIHIIMLTARGQREDKERGLSAGANGYFVKPFSPINLMNMIDEILIDSRAVNLVE